MNPNSTTQVQTPQTFQSASLYVGDLAPDVVEGVLFELFNQVGPVASIRVCRDAVTRRSLGYAYVNFHHVQDAERSLDTMNFTDIKSRPCRIMWSQRDPSLRKSGVGNVFVKNLAPAVDNKGLFDTFSVFGNILSCKVATDENGVSKGYGYVHYETAEAAQDAILKFNGNSIEDMEVFVGPFVRRQERTTVVNWTNLYVKQFPLSWDENKLKEVFSEFGNLANVFLTRDAEGKSKGFAFVNFTEHQSAAAALNALHGKVITDSESAEATNFELYVGRAQKKAERVREMKTKLDAMKEDRVSKYQGMNLYVKNIDDSVTDELFRETFAKFGSITSARIMREGPEALSKGFGFVCFSTAEEASRAAQELNNKLLRAKPLMVTLHQRRDVRNAQLAATYAPRQRFPQNGQQMPYVPMQFMGPQAGGYPNQRQFYNGQQPGQAPNGQPAQFPRAANPAQQQVNRAVPFAGNRPPANGYYGQQVPMGVPPMSGLPTRNMAMPNVAPNGRPMMAPMNQAQMAQMNQMRPGVAPMAQQQRFMNGGMMGQPQMAQMNGQQQVMAQRMMPGQPQQAMVQQQVKPAAQPVSHSSDEQLASALASADPQMQKNMIGEKLYPLIYVRQGQLAGKITGMLLEMDNAELLNLIESQDALENKIQEALIVLKNHNAIPQSAIESD